MSKFVPKINFTFRSKRLFDKKQKSRAECFYLHSTRLLRLFFKIVDTTTNFVYIEIFLASSSFFLPDTLPLQVYCCYSQMIISCYLSLLPISRHTCAEFKIREDFDYLTVINQKSPHSFE